MLRDLEMLKALDRGAHDDVVRVPVIANSQDMRELADALRQRLRRGSRRCWSPATACYVWGADTLQARWRTEALDWLLGAALRAD